MKRDNIKFEVIRVSRIATGVGFSEEVEGGSFSTSICETLYDTGDNKKDVTESEKWATKICDALNKEQEDKLSVANTPASSTSAGNPTPPSNSEEVEKTLQAFKKREEDCREEGQKILNELREKEEEVERLKKEVKIYYKGFTDMASALLIAKKALEKIEKTVESGNLETRRIANEALSQINKGESEPIK